MLVFKDVTDCLSDLAQKVIHIIKLLLKPGEIVQFVCENMMDCLCIGPKLWRPSK